MQLKTICTGLDSWNEQTLSFQFLKMWSGYTSNKSFHNLYDLEEKKV